MSLSTSSSSGSTRNRFGRGGSGCEFPGISALNSLNPYSPDHRTLQTTIADTFSLLAGLGVSMLVITLGVDCLGALYTAYNQAKMRIDDEEWLRNNCRDPVFFSKMRAHTTVCAEVEANARVGAFWAALRDVSAEFRPSLHPLHWICAAVVFLCIPCLCSRSHTVAGRLVGVQLGDGSGNRRLAALPKYAATDFETAVCCKGV